MIDLLLEKWHQHFGSSSPEVIVRAPGRVNIIGEHTDYNEGWVLPGAMSRSVYILVSVNQNHVHHWVAADLDEEYSSASDKILPLWGKYIEGTLLVYGSETDSFNILIRGDLPVGAGVSSSSSLVCGLMFAIQKITGRNETKEELALLGARVEHEIIGLQAGIMDQFAILLSRKYHVMMLDCRTREYQFITADLPGCQWVLINTKVKHKLIDSNYNNRAADCREAVSIIQQSHPEVRSLRDVGMEMLLEMNLPVFPLQRSIYVLEENARVHEMVDAFKNNDPIKAGQLLNASHAGLRDQYEVSCEELDYLAEIANSFEGVYGARMMGGGFGGCVICLLSDEASNLFSERCISAYRNRFGFDPEMIPFELVGGIEVLNGEEGLKGKRVKRLNG